MKYIVDTILVVCAIATTGAVVSRSSIFDRTPSDGATAFKGWQEDLAFNRRIGPANAPYRLVVWTDYQCPACKQFEHEIARARSQLHDSLMVVYRYYPLSMHPLAFSAAVAAECAREQGRFAPMHTALFAARLAGDSLPIDSLVSASGIPDVRTFRRCTSDTLSVATAAVRADLARAQTLNLRGTPGVQIGDRISTGGMLVADLLPRLRANRR